MANKNLSIDRQLVRALTGDEKIRALMAARAGSVSRWAVNEGFIPEQVFMALSGRRPYPEIRERIAARFDLPRAEVDRLLDAAPAQDAA